MRVSKIYYLLVVFLFYLTSGTTLRNNNNWAQDYNIIMYNIITYENHRSIVIAINAPADLYFYLACL